ncbi:MAG: esterase-like activity of phytase family protein [Chitinophagaceae bacterium]|nr:esterase-like activity of phytase family protein [Chitinophagaceae bacterium]
MLNVLLRVFNFMVAIFLLFSCSSTKKLSQVTANISTLKYIDTYNIPFNFKYKNTTVGGLSGIDYDAKRVLYYLVCDDRSDKDPARFYTAKIFITPKGIDSLAFTGVSYMLQPDGEPYPGNKQNRFKTPDPEAIRYNPQNNYLVWSSEGERMVKANDTVLTDPSVLMINQNGKYLDSFALPTVFKMKATENGPRRNGVFEGMSFADNYKTLFVNTEEPLYEDGPRADMADNHALIRIIKFDVAAKKSTAQYAYKLEPVAYAAKPEKEFKINGVPDILSVGNNKLLVIERSFSTGRLPCTIRIFMADLDGATDISTATLKDDHSFAPVKKTLLLNMDDLGIYTDNIEGVTFGPLLPNGHKTLLFIADNNFNILEKSQLFLFEVIE